MPPTSDADHPGGIPPYHAGAELALEAARMGTWTWDLVADRVDWSPVHEALFGYAPGTSPRTAAAFIDRVHPDDRGLVEATGARAIAERTPFRVSYRVLRPDRSVVWIESYGRYWYDDAGRPIRLAGVARDVTERTLLERLDRVQRELLRGLAATSDLCEGLRLCLDAALEMSGLDSGAFYLADEATGDLDLVTHRGLSAELVARSSRFSADSPNARLVVAGTPLYTRDVGPERSAEAQRPDGLRFLAVIPMKGPRGILGCMNVSSHVVDELSPIQRNGLESIAVSAAGAIERLRAQAALREREETFSAIVDQAMDAVALVDVETARIVELNTAAHEGLGYTREELAAMTIRDIEAAQSAAEIRGNLESLGSSGSFAFETRHRAKDGSLRDVFVRARRLDLRGRMLAASVWTDITDQKRAARALQESEARYRALFEASPDGIVILDPTTAAIIAFNDQACAQLGYSREELTKLRIPDIDVLEGEREARAHIEEIVRTGYDEFETIHRTKAGEMRNVHVKAKYTQVGTHPFLHCIWRDVTEKKRVEGALKESELGFRTLIDHAPEGIFVERGGRFVYLNGAMTHMFGGASSADLVGAPVIERFAPHHHADVRRGLELGPSATATQPSEREWLRLDGSPFPAESSSVAIRFQGADARLVFVRDRSAQRQAEAEREKLRGQLEQVQKMESIGRLAGGVAHDFNNLLLVQLGYCELLEENLRPDDPMRAGLKEIAAAAQRGAALTRQLLAFSRRQSLQPRVLDVNELVNGLGKMLRRLIGEDIVLSMCPSTERVVVKADPGQLEQVLVNLAVNARDAMPSGGALTIEVQPVELDETYAASHADVAVGAYVLIAVSDTGQGMSPETLGRIFEPFFTTKAPGRGTGLGLSTVYGIVKQSGGHISAYSEVGRGSCFKVYLPRLDAEAQVVTRKQVEIARGRGELVLVVEDDAALRDLVTRMLENLDYRVIACANGADAILHVEGRGLRPDVVLTDVIMPGFYGDQLVERLKVTMPAVRAIFISGYTDNALTHHGVLDPGVHFLQKPFSVAQLAELVRSVLGDRRS